VASITRRRFVTQAGLAAAGLACVRPAFARARLDTPLGFAIHSLRTLALKDFAGTLNALRAIGYSAVEMVSFKGYGSEAPRDGFGPMSSMAAADVRRAITDAGLTVHTCQFKFFQFEPALLNETIDWARTLGLTHISIGDDFERHTSRSDWQRTFDDLNRYGEEVRRANLRFGIHTQNQMWGRLGDDLIFDLLLREVSPENCAVLLDLGSTQAMHVDAAPVIRKYGSRIFGIHLRDGAQPEPNGYLPALPVGDGNLNWREILTAAREAGITIYTVEMTRHPDQIAAYTRSYGYLRSLTL
jgi:sugar phosphate isomerase/epimerase